MKKILNLFLQLLFIAAVFGCATTQKAPNYSTGEIPTIALKYKDVNQATLEEIMADAVSKDKMVFLDFYTTWCGPCKWMDSNVFNQNDITTKLNRNFVSYKVDAEDFEGVNTALKYNVAAYPTYIFLTPKGQIIHRFEGMIPRESFSQAIDVIISDNKL
ncbi:MAG: thioredoxin domain-containing protein [Spirosomaceae bacterium]|nr:thioredoxin domain-containing protein [Spirosomataceae bacterium]